MRGLVEERVGSHSNFATSQIKGIKTGCCTNEERQFFADIGVLLLTITLSGSLISRCFLTEKQISRSPINDFVAIRLSSWRWVGRKGGRTYRGLLPCEGLSTVLQAPKCPSPRGAPATQITEQWHISIVPVEHLHHIPVKRRQIPLSSPEKPMAFLFPLIN